jgi:hypothetical protein
MNIRNSYFQGQRDADSIEVKFLQFIFALNLMMISICSKIFFKDWIWLNLQPPNGIEGLSQIISSIWKVKDHRYHDMAQKLDTFFTF